MKILKALMFSYGHTSNAVISQHLVLVAAVEAVKRWSWEYLLPTIKVARDSHVRDSDVTSV